MERVRFSLAALLGIIILFALSFGALRATSAVLADLLFWFVFAALLLSILGVVYEHGSRRAFWVGFAVLGWANWLLAYGPPLTKASARLPTNGIANYLTERLQRPVPYQEPIADEQGNPLRAGINQTKQQRSRMAMRPSFVQVWHVVHAWLTLLLAGLGGLAARYFERRGRHTRP